MKDSIRNNCPRCGQPISRGNVCEACNDTEATLPEIAPSAAWRPQDRIRYVGDYEILDEIARGGMGVVYKAQQSSLNRMVALKMILPSRLMDEAAIRRFHVEAEAAAKLQHPNIVGVHEVGEHEGHHYFSMDYVDGKSLAELLVTGPLPPSLAASYAQRLATAMQYAHDRGILHRDLKPSNVIIDPDGRPRITDFGVAKIQGDLDDLTQTGSILGTVQYMAPEQATGRIDAVGVRSDVYALGAMLYEMVTGRPPFKAANVPATLKQVAEDVPVSLRKLNSEIPTELEIIVMKCLEKSPTRRYASAGDLAHDLERFLTREPIKARGASRLQRIESWLGKRPWQVALFLTFILIGLLYGTFGLWQKGRHSLWEADPQQHPGLPSGFSQSLGQSILWGFGIFAVMGVITALFLKQTRGVQWNEMLINQRAMLASSEKPVAPSFCALLASVSILGIGLALYLAARLIQAAIWNSTVPSPFVVLVPCLLMFGLASLSMAWRNRRLALFGAPIVGDEPMPDVVRQEILEVSAPSAMALYRTMRPELTLAECRATVQHWANTLKEEDRRPFQQPISHYIPQRPLWLGTLSVVALLGGFAFLFPIKEPAWWFVKALCGAFGGLCGQWSIQMKTLTKRFLVMLPAAIAYTAIKALGATMLDTGFLTGLTLFVVMLSIVIHFGAQRPKK